jgi:alkylation response protein AidB-like acyl-CoA dehydrogenase
MQVLEAKKNALRGGEWLVKSPVATETFIPELWNEEQKNIAQMIEDFLVNEVHPNVEAMDSMKHPEILPSLLKKAGELGLLGVSIPEELGGMGLDSITGMLTTEVIGKGHSFSVGMAAHTGIGTLPILYFGTDAQKEKYIPKLASGEWLAAYCLTEPDSGSDALGARTTATLSADGKYYSITGQKMWITNGGFADLFIVFAKIDGEKFTGFIVERTYEGISFNEEEKKMGIKGSSTRQIFFNDCKVPAENLLGTIGKGHEIAFNILNIGRLKLAAATTGASKAVIDIAVKYANERKQFQTPIAKFGAIQHKLAEMAVRNFVCESAVYRATADIQAWEEKLEAEGHSFNEVKLGAAREYAVECALLKVLGSEVLDYVVDEAVQVHGGYGFSAEFPVERAYRDSRINRIFEGTNEINRMLSINDLFKKAMKGELDLMGPGMAVQKELMSVPDFGNSDDDTPLAAEKAYILNFKKAALMTAGKAAMKYQAKLAHQQEILLNLSDILIQTYAAESALLRAERILVEQGEEAAELPLAMTRTWITDAAERISAAGKNCIYAMSEGDEQRIMLMGLKRFTKVQPYNTIAARRAIAAKMIEANAFCY